MAASLNKVLLIGNLTRDPEMKYLPSGQAVTTFTIALNRTYQTQQGEKKEEVTFIRIVTWAKRAELCNQYLQKGSSVCVEGRLQTRSWEAQDGSKRNTVEVVAINVQFLSRAQKGGESASGVQDKESIIQDSFGEGEPVKGLSVAEGELSPDEEVPF